MNERLQTLLDAVQRTACQTGAIAADGALAAARRAGALASSARLRLRRAGLEGRVEGCLAEIGGMVYATHTGHPTDSETLLAKLREIDALRAQIRQLEQEAAGLQGSRACPVCGTPARPGDGFCRECGEKL